MQLSPNKRDWKEIKSDENGYFYRTVIKICESKFQNKIIIIKTPSDQWIQVIVQLSFGGESTQSSVK